MLHILAVTLLAIHNIYSFDHSQLHSEETCLLEERGSDESLEELRAAKEHLERLEWESNSLARLAEEMARGESVAALSSKMDLHYDNHTDLARELSFSPNDLNCGKDFNICRLLDQVKAHRKVTTCAPKCVESYLREEASTVESMTTSQGTSPPPSSTTTGTTSTICALSVSTTSRTTTTTRPNAAKLKTYKKPDIEKKISKDVFPTTPPKVPYEKPVQLDSKQGKPIAKPEWINQEEKFSTHPKIKETSVSQHTTPSYQVSTQQSAPQNQVTQGNTLKSAVKSQTTVGYIQQSAEKSETFLGNIQQSAEKSQTLLGNIQQSAVKSQTTQENLLQSAVKSQTTLENIQQSDVKSQATLENIQQSDVKSQTMLGNIEQSATRNPTTEGTTRASPAPNQTILENEEESLSEKPKPVDVPFAPKQTQVFSQPKAGETSMISNVIANVTANETANVPAIVPAIAPAIVTEKTPINIWAKEIQNDSPKRGYPGPFISKDILKGLHF